MQDENNYTAQTLQGWENILTCFKSPESGKNHLFFFNEKRDQYVCRYCLQMIDSSEVHIANEKNHNGMYRKRSS